MIRDMDDKFRKRIEKILNFHLMVKDNDEMLDEIMATVKMLAMSMRQKH